MNKLILILILIFIFYKKNDLIYYIDVLKSNFNNKFVKLTNSFNVKQKICILSMEDRDLEYIKLHQQSFDNYAKLHD